MTRPQALFVCINTRNHTVSSLKLYQNLISLPSDLLTIHSLFTFLQTTNNSAFTNLQIYSKWQFHTLNMCSSEAKTHDQLCFYRFLWQATDMPTDWTNSCALGQHSPEKERQGSSFQALQVHTSPKRCDLLEKVLQLN